MFQKNESSYQFRKSQTQELLSKRRQLVNARIWTEMRIEIRMAIGIIGRRIQIRIRLILLIKLGIRIRIMIEHRDEHMNKDEDNCGDKDLGNNTVRDKDWVL